MGAFYCPYVRDICVRIRLINRDLAAHHNSRTTGVVVTTHSLGINDIPMKSIIFLCLAILGPVLPASTQAPVGLDDVCRAIGGGKVSELIAVMDTEVELTILDQEDIYSREAAGAQLREFFGNFSPTSFGKVHQGASKANDAEYCIGKLATAKGSFRVYIYVAKKGNSIVLQELKFDRE